MKNLYEFLEDLYSNFKDKEKVTFDKFIEGFMEGSLNTNSIHEGFYFDNYLGDYGINYEVHHDLRQIDIFYTFY